MRYHIELMLLAMKIGHGMRINRRNVADEADQWNKTVKVGDEVIYLAHPGAEPQRFKTRSEARVLEGHTAVLFLEGKSGCVAVGACHPASS